MDGSSRTSRNDNKGVYFQPLAAMLSLNDWYLLILASRVCENNSIIGAVYEFNELYGKILVDIL